MPSAIVTVCAAVVHNRRAADAGSSAPSGFGSAAGAMFCVIQLDPDRDIPRHRRSFRLKQTAQNVCHRSESATSDENVRMPFVRALIEHQKVLASETKAAHRDAVRPVLRRRGAARPASCRPSCRKIAADVDDPRLLRHMPSKLFLVAADIRPAAAGVTPLVRIFGPTLCRAPP